MRTSRPETPLSRTLELECTNFDCGHVFGAQVEITHTIRPSMTPDPRVSLRTSPPRTRHAPATAAAPVPTPIPANDVRGPQVPLAANDDDTLGEAFG